MTDEPETYDEAAERVHRAFCDPAHELVSRWDQEMADALKRNGYAIVRTPKMGTLIEDIELELGLHNDNNGECDCGDQLPGETFWHHVAKGVDYRLTATDGDA